MARPVVSLLPWRARRDRPRAAIGFLSPAVRRLLADRGLHPSQVRGTGVRGRITKADVLAAAVDGEQAPAAGPAALPGHAPDATSSAPPPAPRDGAERVPFSPIRRRTGEHLVGSLATAAHAFCATEADLESVERVRRARGTAWRAAEGFGLSYLPFVALAVVDALRAFRHLNASVGADGLVVHRAVHLGVAVDLDFQGLVVPVVHDAETRNLRGLARAIADIASRARARQLTPDDVAGGTFTITNPGPMGSHCSVPIIHQPQVGILATDGVTRRAVCVPVPDGGEGIAFHAVGTLGLSFDHRAVNPRYAAAFVAHVRDQLARRDWAAEL